MKRIYLLLGVLIALGALALYGLYQGKTTLPSWIVVAGGIYDGVTLMLLIAITGMARKFKRQEKPR